MMRTRYIKYLMTIYVLLLAAWTISCSGRPGRTTVTQALSAVEQPVPSSVKMIQMASPEDSAKFSLHSAIKVILHTKEESRIPDSVIISYDGKRADILRSEPWEYSVPGSLITATGRKSLKASAYKDGRAVTVITRFMIIVADTPPKRFGYRVINSYPHDREAFTQGLFYDHGSLYESTGQETHSSLREVELTTGKVLRQLNLNSDLFGEGITLYNDLIYQVTWTSKVGFVYEESTFKQINKFYYQTEGWGLTTLNNRIVMSDGTNSLYFFEPEMFTVVSRLEVYDNEKKVDKLNELEYINGEIWANIWMTDLIARIDPVSGKVNGYIDMKGILNDPDTNTKINVLNGIAFDREENRIFVTGKNWPRLFEIRITE